MAKRKSWGRLLEAILSLSALVISFSLVALGQAASDDVDRAFANATQLHQSGDIEGAIRAYEAILNSHPQRADVRSNLGAAYSRLGRYEDAIEQYKRALALDASNPTIRFNLALAYYKAALFADAAHELTKLIAATPRDHPEWRIAALVLSECQVRLGEYKKVIDLLSPLEAVDSNDRTLAYLLGSAFVGDGQVKKGQELIDRVFRGQDSAEARLLMGSILLLADDGHAAIKELERGLALNPKLPSLRAWYGRTLLRLGDPENAKSAFQGELADNPTDFDANLYMGILLKRDRMFDEALPYLSRAVRLRPHDSYSRYQLGSLYATVGKPGDARRLLEDVVKDFPDFVEARVLLASVYYRLNLKQQGDQQREIIQKLNIQQQAKQPGAQVGGASDLAKPPRELPRNQNRR